MAEREGGAAEDQGPFLSVDSLPVEAPREPEEGKRKRFEARGAELSAGRKKKETGDFVSLKKKKKRFLIQVMAPPPGRERGRFLCG